MPKKRKTRKEKLLHDKKKLAVHEIAPSEVTSTKSQTPAAHQEAATSGTFSLPVVTEKPQSTPDKIKQTTPTVSISTGEYGYLGTDLMRTALLTGAIVFAELLIRLFVKG